MTREEEIVKTADKFAEGYKHDVAASTGFYHGALWADEHPKNPWISVKERLPEEDRNKDGLRKYYSQPVFIRYEQIWDGQTKPSVYYGTAFVFYTGDTPAWSGHNAREGQCTERITHWMPIPKLEKGGEQ